MDQKQGKINFDIDNGKTFFADEVAIIHNPVKFIFDFKSITPRVDIRNQQMMQPFVLKHDVVMMDPWAGKQFLKVLEENIKNYEKKFGEIEKPKAIVEAEKLAKKNAPPKPEVTATETPSYFG